MHTALTMTWFEKPSFLLLDAEFLSQLPELVSQHYEEEVPLVDPWTEILGRLPPHKRGVSELFTLQQTIKKAGVPLLATEEQITAKDGIRGPPRDVHLLFEGG